MCTILNVASWYPCRQSSGCERFRFRGGRPSCGRVRVCTREGRCALPRWVKARASPQGATGSRAVNDGGSIARSGAGCQGEISDMRGQKSKVRLRIRSTGWGALAVYRGLQGTQGAPGWEVKRDTPSRRAVPSPSTGSRLFPEPRAVGRPPGRRGAALASADEIPLASATGCRRSRRSPAACAPRS